MNRLALGFAAATEGEDLLDQITRPLGPVHHPPQAGTQPAVFLNMGQAQFGVTHDGHQNIVEIMGDPPGQRADGFHLLGLAQGPFDLVLFPFQILDARDIGGHPQARRAPVHMIVKDGRFSVGTPRCSIEQKGEGAIYLLYDATMKTEENQQDDLVSLYRSAFKEFGGRALWNVCELEDPTPRDALVLASHLRVAGNLAARRLAERIEKLCHAAH